MKWMVVLFSVLLSTNMAFAIDYTKTFKVSGHQNNTACKGMDTSLPTEKLCGDLTMFTEADYNKSRLDDGTSVVQTSGINNYDVMRFEIDLGSTIDKASVTSFDYVIKVANDMITNADGWRVYLRDFTANSWLHYNNFTGSTYKTLSNTSITNADLINATDGIWVLIESQSVQGSSGGGCPYAYACVNDNCSFVHDSFPFSFMKSLETTTYAGINQEFDYLKIAEHFDEYAEINDIKLYQINYEGSKTKWLPDQYGKPHNVESEVRPYKTENGKYYFKAKSGYVKIVVNAEQKNIELVEVHNEFWKNLGGNNFEFWDTIFSLPIINQIWRNAVSEDFDLKVLVNNKEIGRIPVQSIVEEKALSKIQRSQEYLFYGYAEGNEMVIEFDTTKFFDIKDIYIDYSEDRNYEIYELKTDFNPFVLNEGDSDNIHFEKIPTDNNRAYILAVKGWFKKLSGMKTYVSLEDSIKHFLVNVIPPILEGREKSYATVIEDELKHHTTYVDWFYINASYTSGADNTAPVVKYRSPANNTGTTTSENTYNFNVTDINQVKNCSLIINKKIISTDTTDIDDYFELSFDYIFSHGGQYNWSINCTDIAGNNGTAGEYNLTYTAPYLSSVLDTPEVDSSSNVTQNLTFNITANISCLGGGSCYNITPILRYNSTTSGIPDTTITGKINSSNFHLIMSDNWTTNWTKTDISTEASYDVAVDSNDNIIVSTYKSGVVHTIKYDSDGTQVWDVTDPHMYLASGMTIDSQDNVIITGRNTSGADSCYHTVKYYSNGTHSWNVSNCDGYRAYSVAVDSDDNVTITGRPSVTSYYTVKYNSTGHHVWNVTDVKGSTAYGIAIDSKDNVIVTGYANGYTVKYNASGDHEWNFTDTSCMETWEVDVDSDDNIVIVCRKTYSDGIYTVKRNSDGEQLWTATNNTDGAYIGYDVDIDAWDGIIVTGSTTPSIDVFTVKYDSAGSEMWSILDSDGQWGYGNAVDSNFNVITTGPDDDTYHRLRKYNIKKVEFHCGTLAENEKCQINATVNATGDIGTSWWIDVNFTSDDISVESDDTGNAQINISGVAAPPTDTCTFTAGKIWDVDCSDNCVISTNVDMGNQNLSLNGTGTFTVNANITNIDMIIKDNNCKIVKRLNEKMG